MADYDSSLPVRSEKDGTDERMHAKIVDYTDPDNKHMEVDADNNAHVEIHGNKPDGSDVVVRLSELGDVNGQGDYDATDNSKPASSALVGHDRGATIDETSQNKRVTAVAGEGDSVSLDVALHDASGNVFDDDNPLPVYTAENIGTEVHDFDLASAIAKDATSDHELTVADGKTLLLYGVHNRASGKAKFELQIGDGAISEVFAAKDVGFNSTAKPDADMDFFRVPIKIVGTANGTTVKLIKTNLDNQAQDLYSTFIAVERNT